LYKEKSGKYINYFPVKNLKILVEEI
jgi:hypothetical protein